MGPQETPCSNRHTGKDAQGQLIQYRSAAWPNQDLPTCKQAADASNTTRQDQLLAATTDSEVAPFGNPPVRSIKRQPSQEHKVYPLLLVRDPQGRRTSSVSPATPRDRRVRYRYGRLPTGGVWLRQRLVVACLLAFYYGSTPAIRLY